MTTRCKFQVNEVARMGWNITRKDGEPARNAERVKMSAVYGDGDSENQSFSEATPSGTLEFFVTNPNVVGTFEPGDYYYLDIIPCPKKS